MTQAPSERRRCAQCGRFLAADTTGDICTLCEAAGDGGGVAEPRRSLGRGAEPPPPPFPKAVRPAEGVVIPRPSQLHPGAGLPEPKVVAKLTALPKAEAPPPRAEEPESPDVPETSEVDTAPIRLLPTVEPRVSQARPIVIAPVEPQPAVGSPEEVRDVAGDRMERTGASVDWSVRIVVGLIIGILVGIAVPLLLNR